MTTEQKMAVSKAIAILNEARELLERTTERDLQDPAGDIGDVLLAIEDWQRRQLYGE